ncbi:MAG: tryptophan--tRNA ligase [Vicinamibacteria bacterium]
MHTADIVIYEADRVPVGEDQVPHLELAREIVRRFNHLYGDLLVEPQPLLTHFPRLPGLDNRKMSKSYGNTINLGEDEKSIRQKLKTMVTDPARKLRSDPGDPAKCPVFDLHKVFSTPETQAWSAEGCRTAGIGCIECKNALADHLLARLEPIARRRRDFESRPDDVRDIFREGALRAREAAESTMAGVREAVKLPPAFEV